MEYGTKHTVPKFKHTYHLLVFFLHCRSVLKTSQLSNNTHIQHNVVNKDRMFYILDHSKQHFASMAALHCALIVVLG